MVYKIDVVSRRRIAEKAIPAPESGQSTGTFLWLSTDGARLYVTGDQFDIPVVAFDTATLELRATLEFPHLPPTKQFAGRFTSQQLQASRDGTIGATHISDLEGGFGLQFFSMPDLRPTARVQMYAFDVGRQSAFVDNGKTFLALVPCRYASGPSIQKQGYCLLVVDPGTATMRQVLSLPSPLGGNVPAARFLPEAAGYYIVEAGKERWLVPDRDKIYTYISYDGLFGMVRDVATGRVVSKWRIPQGPYDPVTKIGWLNNEVTLTPDGKHILLSRSTGRPSEPGGSGELIVYDRGSRKPVDRIRLEGGATSNVVFRYE